MKVCNTNTDITSSFFSSAYNIIDLFEFLTFLFPISLSHKYYISDGSWFMIVNIKRFFFSCFYLFPLSSAVLKSETVLNLCVLLLSTTNLVTWKFGQKNNGNWRETCERLDWEFITRFKSIISFFVSDNHPQTLKERTWRFFFIFNLKK